MANRGRGIVRARAGQALHFNFRVRKSRCVVHLGIARGAAIEQTFDRQDVGDVTFEFRPEEGTYKFAWHALVLAEGATVLVTIDAEGQEAYRRELIYSGSGAPPRGFGGLIVGGP